MTMLHMLFKPLILQCSLCCHNRHIYKVLYAIGSIIIVVLHVQSKPFIEISCMPTKPYIVVMGRMLFKPLLFCGDIALCHLYYNYLSIMLRLGFKSLLFVMLIVTMLCILYKPLLLRVAYAIQTIIITMLRMLS